MVLSILQKNRLPFSRREKGLGDEGEAARRCTGTIRFMVRNVFMVAMTFTPAPIGSKRRRLCGSLTNAASR